MITFSSIISLAPFPEDQKKFFIENEGKMTGDQKLELTQTAWEALSAIYQGRLAEETGRMMQEMAQGKKHYSPNDFQEAKSKLVYEFAQKLESASTQGDLDEVRKNLKADSPSQPAKPV